MALGIAFSPTGNMQDEINYLRDKTTKWAEKLARSNVTTYEAWVALKTTVFKTVEYALPTTLLTRKDLQHIISPAMSIGLSKAGICRKVARNIIYTSQKYQGFALNDPYITQGIRKLQLFFNPFNSLTRQLIEESWLRATAECGIGPNFLQHHYLTYQSILTKGWISSVWEFLSETGITLKKIGTENYFRMDADAYLVQLVFATGNWTPTEKSDFNCCRLYLQVELLSDVITANGTQVRQNIFNGIKDITTTGHVITYFASPNPTTKAWNTWKKMLRSTFAIDTQGNLQHHAPSICNVTKWQWYWQPSTDRIVHKLSDTWAIYTIRENTGRTRKKSYRSSHLTAPSNMHLVPITTFLQGSYIKIDGIGNQPIITMQRNIEWCDTIHFWVTGDKTILLSFLEKEQIILLSDAMVRENTSFAAWIISTPTAYGKGAYLQGYAKIFKPETDSHRSECCGILGAIHTFLHYRKEWNLQINTPIHLVCDNKSAINYAGNVEHYKYITSNIPDYDVLGAIRYKLSNISYTFQHIKGRQDNSARPWDILTTINIHVNRLAAEAEALWEGLPHKHLEYHYFEGEPWQIFTNDTKIYKNLDSTIREQIDLDVIPKVWDKYKRINQEWFHEVNWKAMQIAMNNTTTSTKHWALKRCARDCGTHAILKRQNEREDDHCPFCGMCETVEHVYQCQHLLVINLWNKVEQELADYMDSIHTDPAIRDQLLEGIQNWRDGVTISIQPMIIDQTQIGWNGIFEGVLGRHWADEQDIFSQSDSKALKGLRWSQLIIRRLWKIAWTFWENRNLEAHREDQERTITSLKQQVQEEQEKGSQGYGELQKLLHQNEIDRVMQGNITYMTCWLRIVKAKRQRFQHIQAHSPTYTQMRNTLRNFLVSPST